jgi:hypothetical protein
MQWTPGSITLETSLEDAIAKKGDAATQVYSQPFGTYHAGIEPVIAIIFLGDGCSEWYGHDAPDNAGCEIQSILDS